MNKKVIIIGSGGHAKSIANIIIKSGDEVVGFLDDNKSVGTVIINSSSNGCTATWLVTVEMEEIIVVVACG